MRALPLDGSGEEPVAGAGRRSDSEPITHATLQAPPRLAVASETSSSVQSVGFGGKAANWLRENWVGATTNAMFLGGATALALTAPTWTVAAGGGFLMLSAANLTGYLVQGKPWVGGNMTAGMLGIGASLSLGLPPALDLASGAANAGSFVGGLSALAKPEAFLVAANFGPWFADTASKLKVALHDFRTKRETRLAEKAAAKNGEAAPSIAVGRELTSEVQAIPQSVSGANTIAGGSGVAAFGALAGVPSAQAIGLVFAAEGALRGVSNKNREGLTWRQYGAKWLKSLVSEPAGLAREAALTAKSLVAPSRPSGAAP